MTAAHPAFEKLRSQTIDSLQVTVEEYRHTNTGAQHIHISADNNENVFLVALRTVPEDSTGVAHILEHTALCGSEKYPVRDPFFMMIRRSLNTFMNAFTSSDWTAYPFASQNRKDFNNLLDVYLDAVFFSRLDPLDFAQEGHRFDFAETGNAESDLVYKGVVFNEMKGAMSSVPSQLWQTLCKYLFPSNTYHFNSGGDPEAIPDLSYEQLKSFYETHYHPSNAVFMTYGDIPAVEHQNKFEDQALSRFEKLDEVISVPDEKRYLAPIRVEEAYPLTEEGELSNKTHVVLAWLLGKATDLQESLEAQLLASILLDNSASPLQHALETTDLGTAPSPLCGLDDSQKELTFVCGLEGSDVSKAEQVETLIMDVVAKVAAEGVPYEELKAALQQLELHQREVGGDSYPYGLQIIMTALTSTTHRGDPIGLLNLDPALEKLHEDIKSPDFIKGLARDLLLNNQHRVRLTMRPDADLADRKNQAEVDKLASIKAALSDADKQNIITQAEALQERQLQQDDETVLPKVGLQDIPTDMHYTPHHSVEELPTRLTSYAAGTNGLVYQQIIVELPELTAQQLQTLSYYGMFMTELGIGDKDYLDAQRWQAQVAGAISAYTTIRGASDDVQKVQANLTLSAKSLKSEQDALCELMWATLNEVRFDEGGRLRELVAQSRARREQSVTGNGHSLAMAAASAGMSPSAKVSHELNGLAGIKTIKQLDDDLQDETKLQQFCQQLQDLHDMILKAPRQYLLVGETEYLADYRKSISNSWPTHEASEQPAFALEPVKEQLKQGWIANSQVNFCAKAYPTVPTEHPDAAPLTVLGGFLRNGFLHRVIREQGGAYGGGASQDSNIAAFRMFSYRDPRLEETLADFDASIEWLLNTDHEYQPLEEAILGVISSLDKPSSPAGEAKQTFHAELFGRSREKREVFRKRILEVTIEDLKRVASTYLQADKASIAVVTGAANSDKVSELGLEAITL
ncbi:peptidase M16 [Pseudomaricurvus alkylphenolicus]|uniref:insulinase family protein n=1 Tax=Pseudomaricurvus alkylphenolicus TaxID=1306991 RepID=UPI00142072D3|nr:insulinase family protein [Pseudomaricurvus alkylphenolicus]NIB44543.1 peptidase M16 [Pseudomaricurvus alkylphenolicus]